MERSSAPPASQSERVPEDADGATIAARVRALVDLPWSKAKTLVTTGRVSVDGEAVFDAAQRVRAGALIEVRVRGRRRECAELPSERVLHVDHEVVVVNKPAGLLTCPYEREADTLMHRTAAALRASTKRPKGSRDTLYIVQRLDKDTSGVLVFARTRAARKALGDQFRVHSVLRRYQAITNGTPDAATIETDLVQNRGDGLRGSWRGSSRPPKEARHAITHVSVEESYAETALVSCELETGRQHQIRIHLAEAGHPLVGESVYVRGYRGRRTEAERPMLHAATLGFKHPAHGQPMRFEAAPAEDFQRLLDRLRTG